MAVGDVMLDYLTSEKLRRYDPGYPFAAIAPVLKQGDLVFANLECPISDRGKPVQKTYTFRAHTFAIDALTASGINLVSLANNHILDYGTGALEDTLTLLEEHDIAYAGAGRDEAQARKGAAFEINSIKTAVLACSGVSTCLPGLGGRTGKPRRFIIVSANSLCRYRRRGGPVIYRCTSEMNIPTGSTGSSGRPAGWPWTAEPTWCWDITAMRPRERNLQGQAV